MPRRLFFLVSKGLGKFKICYIYIVKKQNTAKNSSLNSIRTEIQKTHLILIMVITIFLSVGGALTSISVDTHAVDQNLLNTSSLISRLYGFTWQLPPEELAEYFNSVCRELPEVDVISIVDSENVRIYHTNNRLIGTLYDGNIPNFSDFSGNGENFQVENENGPSGPQRRTYSAIYNENGEYCGFIMTIILKTSIRSVTLRTVALFVFVTIGAILIEILISGTFSRRIKQKLHGYEPDTFSSMFTVRDDILESLKEGIIAVDKEKNVQFINAAAKKILFGNNAVLDECRKTERDNYLKITEIKEKVFTEKILDRVLKNQADSFGIAERTDDGTEILVDCLPVKKDEKLEGAVAILHDRTEYTKLMEDLAGTKYLVDSMRANNHDFTNKLHVILGLIQIGEYEKAVSYIENISIIQRETLSRVMHSVDNPSFAALLIGKIARASECNVKFILQEGISYKDSDVHFPSEALVTIAGNLIDNAIDSMNTAYAGLDKKHAGELVFGVFTRPGELLISVKDNGCGIAEENRHRVFDNGFSTKGQGRGVGLYHCKQLVESLDGKIGFESTAGIGTVFTVSFKNKKPEIL